MMDAILDVVEDVVGRAFDGVKTIAQVAFAIARIAPWAVGILFFVLVGIGIYLDSGSTPDTIQHQLISHNKSGGSVYWSMEEQGMNPSGFLGMGGYGNKKQEADFTKAIRFCMQNKGFTGCDKVIKAANGMPTL